MIDYSKEFQKLGQAVEDCGESFFSTISTVPVTEVTSPTRSLKSFMIRHALKTREDIKIKCLRLLRYKVSKKKIISILCKEYKGVSNIKSIIIETLNYLKNLPENK